MTNKAKAGMRKKKMRAENYYLHDIIFEDDGGKKYTPHSDFDYRPLNDAVEDDDLVPMTDDDLDRWMGEEVPATVPSPAEPTNESFNAETIHEKGDYRITAEYNYDALMSYYKGMEEDEYKRLEEQADTYGMFYLQVQKKVMGGWETIDSLGGVVPSDTVSLEDLALTEMEIPEGVDFNADSQDETLYIKNSSIFDNPDRKYDIPLYTKILKEAGATKVWTDNAYGWANQPEVVIFTGLNRLEAEKALEQGVSYGEGMIIHSKDAHWDAEGFEANEEAVEQTDANMVNEGSVEAFYGGGAKVSMSSAGIQPTANPSVDEAFNVGNQVGLDVAEQEIMNENPSVEVNYGGEDMSLRESAKLGFGVGAGMLGFNVALLGIATIGGFLLNRD